MGLYVPPDWQTKPQRVQHLMIVCGSRAYVIHHRDPRAQSVGIVSLVGLDTLEPGRELAQLADLALSLYCGAVWLLPTMGSAPDPDLDHPLVWNWQAEARAQLKRAQAGLAGMRWHELTSSHGGAALAGLVAQRENAAGRGQGMPLGIYAPWVNDAWGLSSAIAQLDQAGEMNAGLRAATFARGLALAAFAMGVQLRFSPSYSGLVSLRQELAAWEQNANRAIPELTTETRELLDQPGVMPTYFTWRAADLDILQQLYSYPGPYDGVPGLHIYDRNSSFPSSFRDMPLGQPQRAPAGEWRQHVPGFYLVTGVQAPARWPAHIPGPFHTGEGEGEYPQTLDQPVWAWEPQLRTAKQYGWGFQLAEGYYWPREQVMDPKRWYERFWAARRGVDLAQLPATERRIARALVKKMGVATIGRLRQRSGRALVGMDQAEDQGLDVLTYDTDRTGQLTGLVEVETLLGRSDLNQPAWWAADIANANERLQRQLYGTAWDTGLVYVDSLYTLRPHLELAGDPNKPGGFRSNGFVPLCQEDWQALASAQSVGEAIKYLAHLTHQEAGPEGQQLLLEALAEAQQDQQEQEDL